MGNYTEEEDLKMLVFEARVIHPNRKATGGPEAGRGRKISQSLSVFGCLARDVDGGIQLITVGHALRLRNKRFVITCCQQPREGGLRPPVS